MPAAGAGAIVARQVPAACAAISFRSCCSTAASLLLSRVLEARQIAASSSTHTASLCCCLLRPRCAGQEPVWQAPAWRSPSCWTAGLLSCWLSMHGATLECPAAATGASGGVVAALSAVELGPRLRPCPVRTSLPPHLCCSRTCATQCRHYTRARTASVQEQWVVCSRGSEQ